MIYKENYEVNEEMTALKMGSGDLEVLATPALVAIIENCCKRAITDLKAGETSVGSHFSIDHLKPSKVGAKIEIVAELQRFDGKMADFQFEAYDQGELIGKGIHRRVVVDQEKFMKKLSS